MHKIDNEGFALIERPVIVGVPKPQGPYVPAVRVDNLLFVSGQGPIDLVSNQVVLGSVQEQTRLVIPLTR